jgi:hypothetical protein
MGNKVPSPLAGQEVDIEAGFAGHRHYNLIIIIIDIRISVIIK